MGIVIRNSIINTILLYLGAVIGYINILFLFPKFLSEDQIGLVRVIQDMGALMVPFAQFGLSHSLIRFYPRLKLDEEQKKQFLPLIIFFGLLSYLVFFVVFHLLQNAIIVYFTPRAPEIIEYLHLVLAITFLLLIFNLTTSYCHSMMNITVPNLLKDLLLRILIAIGVILYFSGVLDFKMFLYWLVLSYGIISIILLGYLIIQKHISLKLNFRLIPRNALAELFYYAIFSLLGSGGMLIIGKIDSLMVSGMLGLGLNGIYTTVFYIAVIIEFPKRAISQITLPMVSQSFQRNDIKAVNILYRQTSINQLLIGMLLFIGIWINLDNIFDLMPKGEIFEAGKYVIIIIGFGRLFDMASGINSEIIVMSKYYRFNMLLLGILAIVTILLNLLLIPIYGIEGAAVGSALALILFNLSKFIFLYSTYKIQPLTRHTVIAVFIGAATLILSLNLPHFYNAFIDILIRSTVATTVFCIGVLLLKPSPEVSGLIKRVFRKRNKND